MRNVILFFTLPMVTLFLWHDFSFAAPVPLSAEVVGKLKEHDVEEIVFAVRQVDGDGHWYANFSYWSNNPDRKLYHDGGRLCKLRLSDGKLTELINDPTGGVRDPQVHYSGKKIVFSYRKGGQPYYHLYEINTDGTGLKQLTDGPYDDLEPCYLPDGGIAFCSSRCNRMVNCWFVRVAIVHRCDGDGKNIQPLSCNIEQDNTPWVLPDGRLIYQRWEYIDRSQVRFHHLWTMNPDGTGQMVYYGNMHGGTLMIDAKPIPGTNKVVCLFSPGHGRKEHEGVVTIIDPSLGPDERRSAKPVLPGHYRDPYPISEDCFLLARNSDFGVSIGGQYTSLWFLPEGWKKGATWVHEPRPIRPRQRERVIPQRTIESKSNGVVLLDNAYIGRNMKGIEPGDIKKLLILEALPKPVNFSGGWAPLTLGGTFTLERVVGTVPVEEDGSAHFELPALRSFFFVALDENNMSLKRMQSFMTVMPGERLSCIGCHENRGGAPPRTRITTAMRRQPSRIQPVEGIPGVLDFPRDIQPILDKHCLACHDYEKTEKGGPLAGGVSLSGDHGPIFSHAFVDLTLRGQFADGRNGDGNRPPRSIGTSASPLMQKLDGQHYKVKLSADEKDMIRYWIESGAAYPGTYASLGSGMITGGRSVPDVFERRCNSCHQGHRRLGTGPGQAVLPGIGGGGVLPPNRPNYPFATQRVYNLTRPGKSLVLLAPLSKESGGLGICSAKSKKPSVFKSDSDPDYRKLLEVIRQGSENLQKIKRFDMPGFRPNEHYIREMKVYGILPKDLPDDAPVDPYEIDEKYWRSHWYAPDEGS